MRSAVLLAQLALLTSPTYAFYPYMPEWLKHERQDRRSLQGNSEKGVTFPIFQRGSKSTLPPAERAARAASRLSNKYGRRQQVPSASDAPLVKRDNEYSVLEAADPDRSMTTGLHQDGHDMSYFVQVQIGSEGREYYMLVDTGAGSSWIMSDECQTDACQMHDTFGPDQSDTLVESDDDFEIVYGTGEVNGTLVSDRISIAGISIDYQFGLAHGTSSDFTDFAFDGILGFSMDQGVNQNFVGALRNSSQLEGNLFSIALHRSADGDNVGELSLGTINREKYTGEISYNDIASGHEWTIEIEDMKFNGQGASVGGVRSYIDSGTSYCFGPQQLVERLHRLVPGAESADGRTWNVPCDTEDEMTFTFSGVDYKVSSKDWMSPPNDRGRCTSNIYGVEVVSGAWLLGDTFLKNVYAVFDMDRRQIGFAALAAPESETESETSTSRTSGPSTTSTAATESETRASSAGTTPALHTTSATVTHSPGVSGHEETEAESTTDTTAPEVTADPESDEEPDPEEGSATGLCAQAKVSTIVGVMAMVALLM